MKGLRKSKRALMSSRRRTKSARMNWEVCEKSARSMRKKLPMLTVPARAWQSHNSLQWTRTDSRRFKQGADGRAMKSKACKRALAREGWPGWGQRKSESRTCTYEDKIDKTPALYAGLLRRFRIWPHCEVARRRETSLEEWNLERIYVWRSGFATLHLLGEKGEASGADAGWGTTALLRRNDNDRVR